jgi:predicted lipoprotein with Yx(FWY)xxD motif
MHMRRVLCAAVIAAAVVAVGPAGAATRPLVHITANPSLHARVLVDRAGRTLYRLSAEQNGRFVCSTSACLSLWHPLVAVHGARLGSVSKLATIRRPDGRLQVSFAGEPLYTFAGDTRPGEAKGNGFKDVGVWQAAAVGHATAARPPASRGYGGY